MMMPVAKGCLAVLLAALLLAGANAANIIRTSLSLSLSSQRAQQEEEEQRTEVPKNQVQANRPSARDETSPHRQVRCRISYHSASVSTCAVHSVYFSHSGHEANLRNGLGAPLLI